MARSATDRATETGQAAPRTPLLQQFGEAVSAEIGAARKAIDKANEAIDQQYRSRLRDLRDSGEVTNQGVAESFAAIVTDAERNNSASKGKPRAYSRAEITKHRVKLHPCPELAPATTAPDRRADHSNREGPTAGAFLSQGYETDDTEVTQVSSRSGRFTPCSLIGDAFILDASGKEHAIGRNIWDSGSALTLMGESDYRRYEKLGCVVRVSPLESSIRRVHGIGASNLVLYHARFTVKLGGANVEFLDVPVLANHSGLLFGNDVCWGHRQVLDYSDVSTSRDGFAILRDSKLRAVTREIPISVGACAARAHVAWNSAHSASTVPTDLTGGSEPAPDTTKTRVEEESTDEEDPLDSVIRSPMPPRLFECLHGARLSFGYAFRQLAQRDRPFAFSLWKTPESMIFAF